MSDLSHRLLDLAWENYRVNQLGMESRGSTGSWDKPGLRRRNRAMANFYQSFLEDKDEFVLAIKQRCQRASDTIRYGYAKSMNPHGISFLIPSQHSRKTSQ
jgi:adenylosuccinate synthase